jgi:hypothetical protein
MLNRKNDEPECDPQSNTRRLEISSLQKAAEALRESEEKCHAIIEGIEDGYYEVDLEGNFTFLNEWTFRHCLGTTCRLSALTSSASERFFSNDHILPITFCKAASRVLFRLGRHHCTPFVKCVPHFGIEPNPDPP